MTAAKGLGGWFGSESGGKLARIKGSHLQEFSPLDAIVTGLVLA